MRVSTISVKAKEKANSSLLHPHRSILVESIERVVLVPRVTLCNLRIVPVLFRLRASVITISIALVVAEILVARHSDGAEFVPLVVAVVEREAGSEAAEK